MNNKIKLEWIRLNDCEEIAHLSSCVDQQKIYLKRISKDTKIKKIFFLFHDLCFYSGSFKHFINWALNAIDGVMIYQMDFVGHGQSTGTRCHIEDFDFFAEDIFNFLQSVKLDKNQEAYFFGHGVGGMALLDMYNKYYNELNFKPNKIVLSNFILNIESPLFHLGIKKNPLSKRLIDSLRLIKYYNPLEITHKKEAQIEFDRDPFIIKSPTLKTILEVKSKSKSIYQDAYYIDVPVMIAWSENNKYINRQGMHYFIKGIKKELLSEKTYSLMKHDLYNEIDSSTFFEDIKIWVKGQ